MYQTDVITRLWSINDVGNPSDDLQTFHENGFFEINSSPAN